MENKMQVFTNSEFGEVRTLTIDNEPWFVGKDVAEVLGYEKPRNAISAHVDEEDKKDAPIQGTLGGTQSMTIINESGLYSLIFSSKLPKAKEFKHWVTSEVLPAIRKTGTYNIEPYKSKRTSAGEVASLIKVIKTVMKDQDSPAYKIAEMTQMVCQQFNVELPEQFVVKPLYEQLAFLLVERI